MTNINEEILHKALVAIEQHGKASAVFLQRQLLLGYAEAAQVLDALEEQGFVGPHEGASPRDVFLNVIRQHLSPILKSLSVPIPKEISAPDGGQEDEEIEKIVRDKCILSAWSNCRTLDEAKKREFLTPGCVVFSKVHKKLITVVSVKDGMAQLSCSDSDMDMADTSTEELIEHYDTVEVLGLPCTFSRILNALPPIGGFGGMRFFFNERLPHALDCFLKDELLFTWRLLNDNGTPSIFQDQSKETKKAIARLCENEKKRRMVTMIKSIENGTASEGMSGEIISSAVSSTTGEEVFTVKLKTGAYMSVTQDYFEEKE